MIGFFEAEYHWMMEQYLYVMKKIIMSRNTEISFNKEMVEKSDGTFRGCY